MARNSKSTAARRKTSNRREQEVSLTILKNLDKNDMTRLIEEETAARIGYGVVCFSDTSSLGLGPTVERHPFHVRNSNDCEPLLRMLGGDRNGNPPKRLARFLAPYAIQILVEPGVITSELEKNPLAHSFPQVTFSQAFRQKTGVFRILNGYQRFLLAQHLSQSAYQSWIDAKSALNSLNPQSATFEADYARLAADVTKYERRCRDLGSWLVLFYDSERVNESPLSTNLIHSCVQNRRTPSSTDNPETALSLAINFIAHRHSLKSLRVLQPSDIDLQALKWDITGNETKRLNSALADISLICEVVRLSPFSKYWSPAAKAISVSPLNDWKTTVAPFMDAIFHEGSSVFYFLSSNQPLPALCSEQSLEQLRLDILNKPVDPVPDLFDEAFFRLSNDAYKVFLFGIRDSLGISSQHKREFEEYQSHFSDYKKKLFSDIACWVSQRADQIRSSALFPSHTLTTLTTLPIRLRWVLDHGLFRDARFSLTFETPMPLLCPFMVTDIATSLLAVGPQIDTIFDWIDPLGTVPACFTLGGGSTGALDHCLSYWRPRSRSAIEVLRMILGVIFSNRSTDLVDMRSIDKANKAKRPSLESLEKVVPGEIPWHLLVEKGKEALGRWYSVATNHAGGDYPPFRPSNEDFGAHLRQDLLSLEGGDLVIKAFLGTGFSWAPPLKNSLSSRAHSTSKHVVQSVWVLKRMTMEYTSREFFWRLRASLLRILRANLDDFYSFWDELKKDPYIVAPESSPGDLTVPEKVSLRSRASDVALATKEACSSIIELISRKDVGAIPVYNNGTLDGFALHHEVHDAAVALFQKLAVASHRTRMMYLKPDQDRRHEVDPELKSELYQKLDLPGSFQRASSHMTKVYYTSIGQSELETIEQLGEGSRAAQIRQDNADKKEMARLRTRAKAVDQVLEADEVARVIPFGETLDDTSEDDADGRPISLAALDDDSNSEDEDAYAQSAGKSTEDELDAPHRGPLERRRSGGPARRPDRQDWGRHSSREISSAEEETAYPRRRRDHGGYNSEEVSSRDEGPGDEVGFDDEARSEDGEEGSSQESESDSSEPLLRRLHRHAKARDT